VVDTLVNLAGMSQFHGWAILPLGLKTRTSLPKVMARDEKQNPRATLTPGEPEGRCHSVSRRCRFALEYGVSAGRYIQEVKNEWLP